MSSITHPVGPEEPRVYWRRRVSLLLALVVVVALVAFGLSRLGGSDASAAPPAAPDAAATPAASAPAGGSDADPDGDVEECAQEALQVVATADAGSYPEGVEPQLGAAVRNTGSRACTVDLSPASVELLVVSGADRIWSSLDCLAEDANVEDAEGADAEGADAEGAEGAEGSDAEGAEGADAEDAGAEAADDRGATASDGVVTVAPGEDATLTRAWPRERSEAGCPADQQAPRPGTYQLTATVAGATSTALSFSLG